jgi:hypothetical protein
MKAFATKSAGLRICRPKIAIAPASTLALILNGMVLAAAAAMDHAWIASGTPGAARSTLLVMVGACMSKALAGAITNSGLDTALVPVGPATAGRRRRADASRSEER